MAYICPITNMPAQRAFFGPTAMCLTSMIRRCLLASCLVCSPFAAQAQFVVPEGAVYDLGSGTTTLGCIDLQVAGNVVLASGGSITGVRHLVVTSTGRIDLNGATIQLSQQFTNDGQVNDPGQIVRVDGGAACPLAGDAGPVNFHGPTAAPPPTLIPASNGMTLGLLAMVLALFGIKARHLNHGDGRRNDSQSGVSQ